MSPWHTDVNAEADISKIRLPWVRNWFTIGYVHPNHILRVRENDDESWRVLEEQGYILERWALIYNFVHLQATGMYSMLNIYGVLDK